MKRSKESPAKTAGYKLHRQREGTRVTYWPDPRGPGFGTMLSGFVVDHMGDTVSLVWDHDDEFYETWSSGECRYRVDRGQMRFIPPPRERRIRLPPDQLTCKTCGRPRQLKCGCPRIGALKPEEWGINAVRALLTPSLPHDMMDISIGGNAPIDDDTKGAMMARKKVEAVVEDIEEVEEIAEVEAEVELEELDDATTTAEGPSGDGNILTAKAAASMLKTDGRTLRKFLRKKFGVIGQGQRWEIDADGIEELRTEFEAWSKGGTKADKPAKDPKPKADAKANATARVAAAAPIPDEDIYADLEEIEDLDFGDDE